MASHLRERNLSLAKKKQSCKEVFTLMVIDYNWKMCKKEVLAYKTKDQNSEVSVTFQETNDDNEFT